jgi:pimeloyl-ACP methyl ester carboxylesterase
VRLAADVDAAAPAPPAPLPTSDPVPATLALPHGALAYVDEGPRDAPAVIAVHGIPGSIRDFRYLAPQLTAHVRFVRLELPGFGASTAADDAIDSLTGRARAVLAIADHLALRRFAILGHSMGGATALVLAGEHRDRVDHLLLIASVALSLHRGLGMTPGTYGLLARALGLPLVGPLLVRSAREEYRRRRFPGADDMDAAALRLQLRAIAATDFPRIRRLVAGALPETLLAYARDDHMIETWISEELARALPQARVVSFDEGGHNLQKTRAVELAAAIGETLEVGERDNSGGR